MLFGSTFQRQIQCRSKQSRFARLRLRYRPVCVHKFGDELVQSTPTDARSVRVVPHDYLRSDRSRGIRLARSGHVCDFLLVPTLEGGSDIDAVDGYRGAGPRCPASPQ